jgi:Methyltransferase FkbM domain
LLPNWNHGVKALGTVTVPVTTLDVAIKQFGVPAFCKIDVEGFEAEVLRGLSKTIPNLSLEYHTWSREIKTINECMDILARSGKYEVNLTGQESATFLLPRWLTIQEFKDSFPDCAEGNLWGDVFVHLPDIEEIRVRSLSPA